MTRLKLDMNYKEIADYVMGTMALEGQGLTKKQYTDLLKYIRQLMKGIK